ncbi:ERF superfamily protein [compost metagenome]
MSEETTAIHTGHATRSPSLAKLTEALVKAQAVMAGAKKDSNNPHHKSKYADLASVWDACREPLTKNGLAVIQLPEADGKRVTAKTLLLHTSGEFIETPASATARDDGPQSIGSVITYLRRYSLMAMVGIAPEDDDGEAGHGRETQPQKTQPTQQAPKQNAKAQQPTAQGPKPNGTVKADETAELLKHLGEIIKRDGHDPEAIKAWCLNRGYPDASANLNAEQLTELIEYLTKKEAA